MAGKETASTGLERAHRRFGWTALFVALAFGTVVEGLHGFKTSGYLLEPIRREMWTLAHFHAAALALVNLVYVRWAASRGASRALLWGSALLPLGFFLGGIAPYEGDPGIGIVVAPVGALLVLYAAGVHALAAWRE